jgi:hypothetical protein
MVVFSLVAGVSMGEFAPIHWLVVLAFLIGIIVGIPLFAYRHGLKVGDQQGYIRGYKEGQQASKG